jgi:hypothetical protein
MPVVGVDHIACSCKRIAAQKFGSQIMALLVVAYSRGPPLCRLEEFVEVVLKNSLVIIPLSCCEDSCNKPWRFHNYKLLFSHVY